VHVNADEKRCVAPGGLPMSAIAIAGDLKTHTPRGSLGTLALGALGVVYGDIGTSPLYTMKTALDWGGGATPESQSACCP